MQPRILLGTLFATACGASSPHGPDTHAHAHGGHHAHAGDHGHGLHKDFSDVDAHARMFDSAERDAWQKPDEVVALLALTPGATVADIGAGTGYFEPYLARAVGEAGHVLALDAEPKMVAHMTERFAQSGIGNAAARVVSAGDPGLGAASVDRILIVNTWHHISERTAYATSLRAALRPGGVLAIVDFTAESDIGPPAEHRVSAAEVVAELAAGGFDAELASETLPKQYVVLARAH